MTVTLVQRASRRQGPTTSNEAVKGPCSWTVATNTSWSSPTAQQQTPTAELSATASTEKRCTPWTSFPSLKTPLSLSPSLCLSPLYLHHVQLVLTSSLLRHKEPLKWLRMLYGCMTRGVCWGSESIQLVNEIHWVSVSVTLDLNCMRFAYQMLIAKRKHVWGAMTSILEHECRFHITLIKYVAWYAVFFFKW